MPPAGRRAPEDRDARIDFFAEAWRYAPYLGVETKEGRFVVATSDGHIGRGTFVKGARPEFRVLRYAVRAVEILLGSEAIAGRQFVDIGANIGTTTVSALRSHPFGSAIACEPEAENYRLLRANVALNGLEDHVRSLQVGLSNRVGRSDLVVMVGKGGAGWIAVDQAQIDAAKASRDALAAERPEVEVPEMTAVEVELVTLDLLTRRGVIDEDRAGMVWIDAEGHEGHILEGAGRLLDRGVATVLEFNPAGLDDSGGREKLHEVARQCYTHFVDVRRSEVDDSQPRWRLRTVTELPRYADRFLDPSIGGSHTDLLLLRLDAEQARAGADLPALVSEYREGSGEG